MIPVHINFGHQFLHDIEGEEMSQPTKGLPNGRCWNLVPCWGSVTVERLLQVLYLPVGEEMPCSQGFEQCQDVILGEFEANTVQRGEQFQNKASSRSPLVELRLVARVQDGLRRHIVAEFSEKTLKVLPFHDHAGLSGSQEILYSADLIFVDATNAANKLRSAETSVPILIIHHVELPHSICGDWETKPSERTSQFCSSYVTGVVPVKVLEDARKLLKLTLHKAITFPA
mmetsp:Transcript_90003/g.160225  ORF Transcript_90003/g.160225 Transcript_90003/m.160225 type:complete len:229 (-) Transcript_90003:1357-2043(-)